MKPHDSTTILQALPELSSPLFRAWTLKEAIAPPPFAFRQSARKKIESRLTAKLDEPAIIGVVKALEAEVAEHLAWSAQEQSALTPRERQRRLRALTAASAAFRALLENLDWDTRREVAARIADLPAASEHRFSAWKPDEMTEFDRRLCDVFDKLLAFETDVAKYLAAATAPSAGRRARPTTLKFGVDVAMALTRTAPGAIPITATRRGPFETILEICLEATRGAPVSNVHRIALSVIREIRRGPTGCVNALASG